MSLPANLSELVVMKLMHILKVNPYTIFLKSLIDFLKLSEFYIALNSNSGLHQRTYNLPTASEVGAIWIEEQATDKSYTPHIQIYTHNKKTQIVNYYYGCYDQLQYPLLFPHGQNGWHCGIKKVKQTSNNFTSQNYCESEQLPSVMNMASIDCLLDMESEVLSKEKKNRQNVSCCEYYCYKLQIRERQPNETLHSGRVFQ